jgi:transposase-like protein
MAAREADVARESRCKSLPPSIGRKWSDEEKQQLIDEFQRGVPHEAIAPAHGRTLRAIESRLEVMGLITAAERTTKNRFQSEEPDAHDS